MASTGIAAWRWMWTASSKKLQPQADLPPDEMCEYADRDTMKEKALHHVETACHCWECIEQNVYSR